MNKPPYYTSDMVGKTTQLIIERFNVMPDYAQRLALGALKGIESHGGDSTDWETVVNTVMFVVASWIENGFDFPHM